MKIFEGILLLCLILCSVSVAFTKNLLTSIVIFMSYSLIMCVVWILLQSPDLAVTEAAVGAGVTSILFFVTLKKIRAIHSEGGSGARQSGDENEETGPGEAEAGPLEGGRR